MHKRIVGKSIVMSALWLVACVFTAGATDIWGTGEVPRITDPADVPQTLEAIWTGYEQGYDAHNPLEAKIHKTWEVAGDIEVNWVQLTVGTFQGKKAIVCGYWAISEGRHQSAGHCHVSWRTADRQ
jgi:hypothetical protein